MAALPLFDLSPGTAAVVVAATGALALTLTCCEASVEDTLGNITDDAAAVEVTVEPVVTAVVDLGAVVVDFGTALPATVVVVFVAGVALAFEAALVATDPRAGDLEEAFDDAGVGFLLDSVLRFRLTVFFLVFVPVPPVFLVSVLLLFFAVALDFPPVPPVDFLLVVLLLDAVEVEFPVPAEDAGLGGGAMPNNRSSSRTLSSGASIDPPILDNLSRFD